MVEKRRTARAPQARDGRQGTCEGKKGPLVRMLIRLEEKARELGFKAQMFETCPGGLRTQLPGDLLLVRVSVCLHRRALLVRCALFANMRASIALFHPRKREPVAASLERGPHSGNRPRKTPMLTAGSVSVSLVDLQRKAHFHVPGER